MIELIASVTQQKNTRLASLFQRFDTIERLKWSELISGDLAISWLSKNGQIRNILNVYERSCNVEPYQNEIFVTTYQDLEVLASIEEYPGLATLLSLHGSSREEFDQHVLEHYAAALDVLASKKQAYVFGSQRLGQDVSVALRKHDVSVLALLDNDQRKHGTFVAENEICGLDAVRSKDIPVIIATTRFASSIRRQLEGAGIQHIIPYPVMTLGYGEDFPDEIPYVGIQEDFAQNIPKHLELFLSFADEKSRRVLDGLLAYRLDYDSRRADSVADVYQRQYFDDVLIDYRPDGVFVDLGGYDGDTAEKFIQFSSGVYKKIYLFEPDENLMARAQKRLSTQLGLQYVNAGAYSKDGELRFSASGRTNGAVSDAGDLVIPCRKLDSVVQDKPTLIKMDIEGSETEALRGAGQLIKKHHPKLAIAAYHFGKDFWHLADVIRDIDPSYQFYLRHYSETGLESVIYAV